jgi:WD40 repeat protein
VRLVWLLLAALLLAACAPQTDVSDGTPTVTPTPTERPTPTPLPVAEGEWLASTVPLSADNAASLRFLGRLEMPEPPSTLFSYALSVDQTRFAGLNNDMLIVWDLIDGERVFQRSRLNANRVFYAPDKERLYLLGAGAVALLNADDGEVLDEIRVHPDYSEAYAYDPLDGRLLVGGNDGTLKLWSLPDRQSVLTTEAGLTPSPVTAAALSPTAGRFAGALSGAVWLFGADGERIGEMRIPQTVYDLRFTDDGRYLIANAGGTILLWDTEQNASQALAERGGNEVFLLIPDSPYLIIDTESGVNIWNVATRQLTAFLTETGDEPLRAAVSPDGTLLLTVSYGRGASLWNLSNVASGSVARGALRIDDPNLLDVAISGDGFVALFFDARGPIHAWGIAN